jgi:hypothetical protein
MTVYIVAKATLRFTVKVKLVTTNKAEAFAYMDKAKDWDSLDITEVNLDTPTVTKGLTSEWLNIRYTRLTGS